MNKEERYSRVPRLLNKEERYSRVPRLSQITQLNRDMQVAKREKNAIVEYLDYQIPEERYSRVPRLSDTRLRYSRVPRLSDTRYSANNYQREMEICKQQSEIVGSIYRY